MGRKTHTFDSSAQEKWAFATKKSWAHRWGETHRSVRQAAPRAHASAEVGVPDRAVTDVPVAPGVLPQRPRRAPA